MTASFAARDTAIVNANWNLRRTYRFTKAECLAFIRRLTSLPTIQFDDAEGVERALDLAEQGADSPDALIHSTFEQFQCDEAITLDRGTSKHFGWRMVKPH